VQRNRGNVQVKNIGLMFERVRTRFRLGDSPPAQAFCGWIPKFPTDDAKKRGRISPPRGWKSGAG